MDFHELQKTRIADLRELARVKCPEVKGVVGLRKEQLVDLLAERLGLEKPHKHIQAGLGKRAIKAQIRQLKAAWLDAFEKHDHDALKLARRAIHRRKRRLRRLATTD